MTLNVDYNNNTVWDLTKTLTSLGDTSYVTSTSPNVYPTVSPPTTWPSTMPTWDQTNSIFYPPDSIKRARLKELIAKLQIKLMLNDEEWIDWIEGEIGSLLEMIEYTHA